MKFFRKISLGLVVLAVCLCALPAFASAAPDPADAYAPEAGEVLTDDPEPTAPAGDDIVSDDTPSDEDGDDIVSDDTPPVVDDNGSDSSGSSSDVITASGTDVTVYLYDRSYAFVVDVDGGEAPVMEDVLGEAPVGSGTLPGFLRAMFGEYTPKTQTVTTYFDGQPLDVSTEYVPGIAGMDVEWIASVVLFGLVVYCLFRLLGGMVR